MYPRLIEIPLPFEIGGLEALTVYSYGFMVVMGVLTAAWLAGKELDRLYRNGRVGPVRVPVEEGKGARARTREVSPSHMIGTLAMLAAVTGFIGARLLFILERPVVFARDPLGMLFASAGFNSQVPSSRVPDSTKLAVAAHLEVTNLRTNESRRLSPIYLIMQDRSQQYIRNMMKDWRLSIGFTGMSVDSGQAHLTVTGAEVAPEDWVVVRASVKPFINLFWAGILILTAGFGVALVRRIRDLRFRRQRQER